MKQIAQNYKSGELSVLDVPAPVCRPGGVLVQSLFSLISTGTEMMKVTEAKMSMVGMARARPDQVRKVLDSVSQQGAVTTYKKVMSRLDSYTPLGYSLSGVVVEVGQGAEEFQRRPARRGRGQRVRPARGVQLDPRQPVRPRPAGRRARARGLLHRRGDRNARRAARRGAARRDRVRHRARPGRPARGPPAGRGGGPGRRPRRDRGPLPAGREGRAPCCAPRPPTRAWPPSSRRWPRSPAGAGADHVLLAAGGSSNGPVEAAARLARDRARVVDIGKTRLDLPWNAYYDKELDVRFSRSYGPGRYDDRYELEGIDYPAGYVRWTERRNLECFLDLIARKEIEVAIARSLASSRWRTRPRSTATWPPARCGRGRAAGVPGAGRGQPAARRPAS